MWGYHKSMRKRRIYHSKFWIHLEYVWVTFKSCSQNMYSLLIILKHRLWVCMNNIQNLSLHWNHIMIMYIWFQILNTLWINTELFSGRMTEDAALVGLHVLHGRSCIEKKLGEELEQNWLDAKRKATTWEAFGVF